MIYTESDVMEFIENEDVKFIRLAFCDVFGVQKNISIMPSELERAFEKGIPFDASNVRGFRTKENSDLLLFPDPVTLNILPWRPSHGRVVRLFCNIKYPDGRSFEADGRALLKKAVTAAKEEKIFCNVGSEFEFYLFLADEAGNSTGVPHDNAGYMDVAPEDKGENVRREICLTLEQMGIMPESSHHERGPGQHEVDFKYSDPLTAADNAITFKWVVRTTAARNGLYANISPSATDGRNVKNAFCAGILKYINDITAFLNISDESYERLGEDNAPRYISWSTGNCSQLIRMPNLNDEDLKIELRSPDCLANPYLAYSLLIYAGLAGVREQLSLPDAFNIDLSKMSAAAPSGLQQLPTRRKAAVELMQQSNFVKRYLSDALIKCYLEQNE